MIPAMNHGRLPAGIHEAGFDDVVATFAVTPWREWLVEGLRFALVDLANAGCGAAYLDGSYTTAKAKPGDYDLVWDMAGVDFSALHPVLLKVNWPRAEQKARYRGDVLPNLVESNSDLPMLEFFQLDKDTGSPKGIVKLNPGAVTP
jgi:hypothetical protein